MGVLVFKHLRVFSIFFLFGIPIIGLAQTPLNDHSWDNVFDDNFETLNTTRWYHNNHVHGTGSDEDAYAYMNDNAYVSSMVLFPQRKRLIFKMEKVPEGFPHPGSGPCVYPGGKHYYKSGIIQSCQVFKYGYFEVTTKMPMGYQFFPAFWLYVRNIQNGYHEIDIFEVFQGLENAITTNLHWNFESTVNYHELHDTIKYTYVDNIHSYHKYAVEWTKSRIIWFVDDKIIRVEKNNIEGIGMHSPMELIVNLARSTRDSDEHGTIYPGYMYIKNVKVAEMRCDIYNDVVDISDFNVYDFALKRSIKLSGATTIPQGSNLSFRATNFIELSNGLEIPQGTEVYFEVGEYQ